MTHKDHKEGMEERFDKRFPKVDGEFGDRGTWITNPEDETNVIFTPYSIDLKDFIHEELSHQLTTIQEMVEGEILKICSEENVKDAIEWAREQVAMDTSFANEGAEISSLYRLLAKLKEIKQ